MNRWVFNGCMAAGVVLVSVGAGLQFGVGYALITAGGLLIVLTLGAALIAKR